MRHRLFDALVPVELLIVVNVQCALVGLAPGTRKDRLSASQFAVDGHQRTADRSAVQVGNGADDMRKMDAPLLVHEGIRQTAALIIDQDEGHLVGAEVDRHG